MIPSTITITNEDVDSAMNDPKIGCFWPDLEYLNYMFPVQDPNVDTICCNITATVDYDGGYHGPADMEGTITYTDKRKAKFVVSTTFNHGQVHGNWYYHQQFIDKHKVTITQHSNLNNGELVALITINNSYQVGNGSVEIVYNKHLKPTSGTLNNKDVDHILNQLLVSNTSTIQQKLKYVQPLMYC